MTFDYKITVFTPTYNRAYIIEDLYRSLQRQTYTAFEWVVVDDGSKDNTQELFERWMQEENPFPIRYYKQENGGKCRAINTGLGLARGELFLNVDSDDHLTEDALEKIIRWEAALPKEQSFCGITGNLGISREETPNKLFEGGYFDGNALDRYGAVTGERSYAFYTQIHKQYLYPDCPGEKFMTEAVAWNRMAHDGYKIRYHNDIICIYEYKDDGLTMAGDRLFWENPQGTGIFFREKAEFLKAPLAEKLKLWYGYATEFRDRCTQAQIAQYIGMPRWLVGPVKWLHSLVQVIKKKR